jgi:tetratricopeptide (TPR) repeat protein
MPRLAVVGALVAGLLLAGCTASSKAEDDGWELLVARDFQGARAYYETVLAERPNDPYANLNLGVAYEELGDKEMAAKHYRVALANGKNSQVRRVLEDGSIAPRETYIAKVAEENLAKLGS